MPDKPNDVPVRNQAADDTADATDEMLVERDLLIEDVSIDGMCGVY